MEWEDDNHIFELRKDINTPHEFVRAGMQGTKAEWIKRFPNAFKFGSDAEWFIDISKKPPEMYEPTFERQIVDDVFKRHNLHSLSYKDAAEECIEEFIKRSTNQKL